jgi:autotransporter-associated beta strand protein/T5SS/PEP-CTERM-associated repeat protein
VTLASPLAGPGASLTKLGTGTLALAGGNSFTAGTVLGGGVLRLGSADALGSTGPISFVGGTLQFTAANTTDYSTRFSTAAGQAYALDTNGQDVTFATSLSSTGGSLTKVGAGTLTLTGALNLAGSNLFDTSDDGRTRVAAGTLVLPGGASLNGSHLTVDGTGAGSTAAMLITGGSMGPKGTRDFGGTGLTVGSQGVGVLTINAGVLSGHSLTIGDQAGSNGTVTVNGGTTNLSGALYVAARGVGMLTLNAGQVNSDYLIAVGSGDGTVGTLTMTGGTLTTVGADSLGGYIGNASSGILQMSGGRADFRGLFIGVHSGGISGTGTLIVSGGTVAVQERFWLGHGIGTAGTLNILDTGVVDVGSGTGAITLAFTGSNSSGVLNIGTGATAGTLLAGTVEGARSTARVNFNHTGTTSFSPALTGTMNVSKLGGGTTILTGSSTFTGTTTISAGTLQVGDGGTNGWLGDSPVVNNAVLVFDRSDSTTYGGTISGQGSLTKLGAGATTLTGSNTYSGTTTIVAGTLEVATGGSIVSGSTMDVRNGTLLVTGGRIDANQTWIGTTTGSAGVVTVTGGTLASSGDLRVGMGPAGSGTGTLTISNGGVVDVGGQIYKADTSTINLNAGGTLRVADSIYTPLVNDGTLVFTGVQTQQIGIPITGTGAMVAAGPLLYVNGSFGSTGGMTIAGGTVQVTPPGSLAGDVVNNGGELAFLLGGSKTFAGAMSGSGGLFVNGWTLTLTGSSTFTGVTMVGDQGVSAGRLEVGNGGTTGSLVSDILVARSSSVVFNRSDVVTYAGSITGQGRLAKLGAGTLTLTGSSGFTGGATVTGGTLSVGNSGTAGSLPGNVTLGKDTGLVFNRSDSIGFTGNISGKGSLTKLGSGALTLSGSNSFTGQTTVSAGTLILNGSSALAPTAAVVVAGGATLQANQPIRIGYLDSAGTVIGGGNLSATLTVTRSGSIGGIADGSDSQGMFAAGIAKLGTGTSTVSAPNTYTGLTWVREGTLGVGVSNAFSGSSSLTVDSGAAFDRAGFSQSVNGAAINGSLANTGGGGLLTVTGTLSGSGLVNGNVLVAGIHAPGNSPGSQTFTGDLTYAAGAAVNWELVANTTGSAGTLADQIVLPTGSLAFSGSTALNLSFDAAGSTVNWSDPFWAVDRAWLVYDLSAGTTTGIGNLSVATVDWLDANAAAISSVRPGSSFSVGLSGQDVVLNYVAAVPEPGSLAFLAATGALGLLLRRRKLQPV